MRRLTLCCFVAVLLSTTLCFAFEEPKQDAAFSEGVAGGVIDTVRNGLVGHNPEVMLSAFDRDKMAGYNQFADQLRAFFDQYESFRVYARVTQTAVENGRGIAMVEFQLEETPRDPAVPPIRKTGQLRLVMERGGKGWKLVDFSPRNFFS